MFKRFINNFSKFFVILFVLSSFACSSVPKTTSENVLIERPERMCWEIKGAKGSIFVFGTVHVGSDSLYPLPESVMKAFNEADKIYAELSPEDLLLTMYKIAEGTKTAMLAPVEKQALKSLTETEKKQIQNIVGAEIYAKMEKAEPWVINQAITAQIIAKSNYDPKMGLDFYFYNETNKQNKTVFSLDKVQAQVDFIKNTFASYEEQVFLLKKTLKDFTSGTAQKELAKLLKFYETDNKQELFAFSKKETENFPEDLSQRWQEALLINRNKAWAKTFEDVLNTGENVFVFAGALHFVGDNSVFEIMKTQGTLK